MNVLYEKFCHMLAAQVAQKCNKYSTDKMYSVRRLCEKSVKYYMKDYYNSCMSKHIPYNNALFKNK